MQIPALFKPRLIWLPSFFGLFVIAIFLMFFSFFVLKNIATFLSVNNPVSGQYLVVEGWIDQHSLLQAIQVYNKGNYQKLITTGGPDYKKVKPKFKTFAESAAHFIREQGVDSSKLVIIPTPASKQDRTYLSAIMVKKWLTDNKMPSVSIDIFTSTVHSRRSHLLYKMAFAEKVKIGIIPSSPRKYTLQEWWKTSVGAKTVLTELFGLAWAKFFFYPSKQNSY